MSNLTIPTNEVSKHPDLSEHDKRVKQLNTFNEIGKALTSTLDLKEVLNIVMEKISETLTSKNWSLLMVDEERDDLYFEIVVGEGANTIKDVRLKLGEGIAGWVAKEGKPVLVPDVSKDPRFSTKVDRSSNFETKSVVCVPMKSKGKCLGVIELINEVEDGSFGEEDLLMLMILADYTAIAIENANYLREVQELTITDDLTKLYNSRHLASFLDYEVERARRYNMHLSLIFFDIDKFKIVNDTHGHLIGSKLLQEVASVIRTLLRKVDMACRYGGDEFVLVLPQTTKEQAYQATKKLRDLINSHIFLKEDKLNLRITASFGIASYPNDACDKLELINLADQAMYRIKAKDRDGIASYS
ncbi:MAG: diguanylate cyclase [Thermodesulfobacteriota bacterium]